MRSEKILFKFQSSALCLRERNVAEALVAGFPRGRVEIFVLKSNSCDAQEEKRSSRTIQSWIRSLSRKWQKTWWERGEMYVCVKAKRRWRGNLFYSIDKIFDFFGALAIWLVSRVSQPFPMG